MMKCKPTFSVVTLLIGFCYTNVMASTSELKNETIPKPAAQHLQPQPAKIIESEKAIPEGEPYSYSRAFEVDRGRMARSLKELFYNNEQP